ncbi:MAG: Serine/threonine-protein kinase PknD [Gemmatimonadaceae bacterium]|nr:Serine/threonine-protein kinase PknD [Gemmatimonadaceae bacterium]
MLARCTWAAPALRSPIVQLIRPDIMFCPDCGTWNRARAVTCVRCTSPLPEISDPPIEQPDAELTALRKATGGRYHVIRRMGSGGMAHVYYAQHATLERPLVIKVLHAHLARDEEMRVRFRREAEAASQLVHPHICPILDYRAIGELVFLVMPFMAGGSLADVLARDRCVPASRSAAIGAQIASALDYAHRRGIVHRDVKPDNILFDEDGHSCITDFGIATARFHGRLTKTGRAMGTPHYMSPEQAMGKMVDGRSDLYAIGVMLYEMLLGFPPFDGADSYSVGYKQVHETAVAPDAVDSRVPAELSAIIMKCLAKPAGERYQTGVVLADALIGFMVAARIPNAGDMRNGWLARRSPAFVGSQ